MPSKIDNSIQERMLKNKPSISIVPQVNKRIIAGRIGMGYLLNFAVLSTSLIFMYKLTTQTFSYQLYDTRKNFRFLSDPYSGKVSCQYRDIGYKQQNI